MGASLDDGAVVENGDFVAEFAGGQAVADVDGGAVTDNFGKFLVDLGFRYRIQGSGWFVQNDKGSILIEGSCDSNFLASPPEMLTPDSVYSLYKQVERPWGILARRCLNPAFSRASVTSSLS